MLSQAWSDAPVIVLSCPGPASRYPAAIVPLAQLAPTQSLLGWEAQLLGFAAAAPAELRARMVFAPMPEIFDTPHSLLSALRSAGLAVSGDHLAKLVHVRFGGVRLARLLKGTRNCLVLAENDQRQLIGQTRNLFADGRTVPAAFDHIFVYEERPPAQIPRHPGGTRPDASVLEETCYGADLAPEGLAREGLAQEEDDTCQGFEAVPLNQHKPDRWVKGPPAGLAALPKKPGLTTLLLPWNLADPVSAVPDIMMRVCRLRDPQKPAFRVILLPFNYPGKLALIRTLMRRIKDETVPAMRVPEDVLIARVHGVGGIAALRALNPVAWIDGNDPEHRFTFRRLHRAQIASFVISASKNVGGDWGGDPPPRIDCADQVFVESASSFGTLAVNAAMPTPRAIGAGLQRSRGATKSGGQAET